MAFHNELFPDSISYGARWGPGHNTLIQTQTGGAEERIGLWSQFKVRGTVDLRDHTTQESALVLDEVAKRRGSLHTFRVKNWADYATTVSHTTHNPGDAAVTGDDVALATGDGTTTVFQLAKFYGPSSSFKRSRNIILPVASTVIVKVDGVLQTDGVDYTFNTTTGKLTFTTAPALGLAITCGFEFDTMMRFDETVDDLLELNITAFAKHDIQSVGLIEVTDEAPIPGERAPGGGVFVEDLQANRELALTEAAHYTLEFTAASRKAILPRADDLGPGTYLFSVHNPGTFAAELRTTDDTLVKSLAIGATLIVHLGFQSNNTTKEWIAHD